MARHRHGQGYVALVLAGGYIEAGDRGRFRVEAGHAALHGAHESHLNEFFGRGAQVLNLPLPPGHWPEPIGHVDDADAIARLAERDPAEAVVLLRATFRPAPARLDDWPDRLARALADDPALDLAAWADAMGIAPASLSRGFRRTYGTTAKRYRLEQRAIRALHRLPHWPGSIADLAADTGFADQAHLTRALTAMTGRTPRQLRG